MVENPYPIPRQLRQSGILVGNGGDTYGPFDFQIFDPADVIVFARATSDQRFSEVAGVAVTKVNGNTALNPLDFFTIKFPYGVPATTRYVVLSSRVAARSAGVMSGTRIGPDALEREFSKLATQQQELRRDVGRAVMVEFGEEALVIEAGISDGDTLMKKGDALGPGPNLPALASELIAGAGAEADRAKMEADRSDWQANRSGREADRAASYVNDIASEKEVPIVGVVQALATLNLPTGMTAIRTNGFYAMGDSGAWPLAIEVPNVGDLEPWQRRTNSGTRRWELVPDRTVRPEMFGALEGSGNDSAGSLADTYAAAVKLGCDVDIFNTYYVKSGTLTIPESVVTFTHGEASIVASSPGVVVKDGTTIMYRPLGGAQVRGVFVDIAKGVGGFSGANPHNYNFFRIQSDQLDGTAGSGSKVNGFFINHSFGGLGTKGGRHALEARLTLGAATENTNPDRNYCAVAGFGLATVGDGGVPGAERGSIFGMNPQGRLSGAATGFLNVTAGEANVGIAAGCSAKIRSGWSIVGLGDTVRGTDVDAGLSISNYGDPVTGAYFTDGILLGAQNGRPALREFSTVLRVQGNSQLVNGIDFASVTFTTDILRATNVRLRNSELTMQASNAHITLGSPSSGQTPYLDFRSGGAGSSYDSRLIASGGGASDGLGDIRVVASNLVSNKHKPYADNVSSLGDASFRWSQLFAGTATINTSDERLKTTFRTFTPLEREAIMACRQHIGIYQWLDAVAEKSEDGARLHAGIPAQRCIAEFESRGLDPWRYAWFCRDRQVHLVKRTQTEMRQVTEQVELEEVVVEILNGIPIQR
ncbi:tail fiber domain-containing protein, partial [Agrobacterium pusense]|uniref:tail fiber domain-containing protein n=1 Tax=Agrobacterium pusense TaxID=648995 RepID=UPI003A5C3BB8